MENIKDLEPMSLTEDISHLDFTLISADSLIFFLVITSYWGSI